MEEDKFCIPEIHPDVVRGLSFQRESGHYRLRKVVVLKGRDFSPAVNGLFSAGFSPEGISGWK